MSLKKIFSLMVVVGGLFSSPIALAAGEISFQVPEKLELETEVAVVIEITEEEEAVEVDDLEVSYSPREAVYDEVLYDCNDPAMMDNCRVNNRGVAGIFEAVFDLKKVPLTISVEADGVSDEVVLGGTIETIETIGTIGTVGIEGDEAGEANEAISTGGPIQAPSEIQAGPSPSWWIILVPFGLMCLVVTGFVKNT